MTGILLNRQNLLATNVIQFDANRRGPEERALMLHELGFRRIAYDGPPNAASLEAEIQALDRHGIDLVALTTLKPESPDPEATLHVLERRGIHPHLLVDQRFPATLEDWVRVWPSDLSVPRAMADIGALHITDLRRVTASFHESSFTTTREEQAERVRREADRILTFARVAATHGCRIALFNHKGWFGMLENQLAILDRLRQLGVTDAGIVYDFASARDTFHDDTVEFSALWDRVRDHVVAVNVCGLGTGDNGYPSQGVYELEMLRDIQDSGWTGWIGVYAVDMSTDRKPHDAELMLSNGLRGLEWLSTELTHAGSGGQPPFPVLS